MDSQFPQPHLEEGTTYYPLRPTYIFRERRVGYWMEKGDAAE